MTITYFIGIDRDDDGCYAELTDTISGDVLRADWHLGMSAPYVTTADIAQATITVRNQAQEFSPEITSDIIGKPLIIQSDDGVARTHFTGFVHRVRPQTGDQGTRLAEIIAYDRLYDLTQKQVRLPLLVNVRADQAIDAILDQVLWRYRVLEGYCIIGRSSIGSSTIFEDVPITRNLEVGKSIFEFVAHDWEQGISARQAIQRFTDGETGHFFFNRDGQATFYNRHHMLLNATLAGTFNDDVSELVYQHGEVVNHFESTITPRTVGASNTLLWSLDTPLSLSRWSSIQLITPYHMDDEPVGATDLITPLQPQAHYQAFDNPDLQTNDLTHTLAITILEQSASATVLEIRNQSNRDVYLTKLEIRGTPLITHNPITLTAQDRDSITFYGQHTVSYDLPLTTDSEEVTSLMAWELERRSQPRGIVREVKTNRRNHPQGTLALTLFDVIRIQESQTGHDGSYVIIAEHHRVDRGGTRHQVSWLVEPADTEFFFVIGTHSIGDAVIIAPR